MVFRVFATIELVLFRIHIATRSHNTEAHRQKVVKQTSAVTGVHAGAGFSWSFEAEGEGEDPEDN